MSSPRADHTATLLNNGKVLFVGGYSAADQPPLTTAELYDIQAQTFTFTAGAPGTARARHTATLLPDGTVLIAGGIDGSTQQPTNVAEIYDPQTDQFTPAASPLNTARYGHTATLLNDGTVLLAGGATDTVPTAAASAELYTAGSGFAPISNSMSMPRAFHTATLLNDGTVLVAGGITDPTSDPIGTAEVYSAGNFKAVTATMSVPRALHTATLLNNGSVLFAGGGTTGLPGAPTNFADLYDPDAQIFTATGVLNTARSEHTATLLSTGTVLVLGGVDNAGNTIDAAELYQPASLTPPYLQSIAITPASITLSPGGVQPFLAIGTFNNNGTIYSQQLAAVNWMSTDISGNNVVSISNDASNSGNATAVALGSALVTAGEGTVTATAIVNVGP
jgi:hypothetical protein